MSALRIHKHSLKLFFSAYILSETLLFSFFSAKLTYFFPPCVWKMQKILVFSALERLESITYLCLAVQTQSAMWPVWVLEWFTQATVQCQWWSPCGIHSNRFAPCNHPSILVALFIQPQKKKMIWGERYGRERATCVTQHRPSSNHMYAYQICGWKFVNWVNRYTHRCMCAGYTGLFIVQCHWKQISAAQSRKRVKI